MRRRPRPKTAVGGRGDLPALSKKQGFRSKMRRKRDDKANSSERGPFLTCTQMYRRRTPQACWGFPRCAGLPGARVCGTTFATCHAVIGGVR